MKGFMRMLALALLPLLLACPGPIEKDPVGPPPDPNQPSIGFQYVGRREVVAGEWRAYWFIDRAPSVGAPTRMRQTGPGTLVDRDMVPLDLASEASPNAGYYLPPADVPAEGATVKVGCSVLSPFTNRWESSPDYEIKVLKKTTPMEFFIGNYPGYPSSATVKAGEGIWWGLTIRPYPATRPIPTYEWIPLDGYSGDTGTLQLVPTDDGGWRAEYIAPSTIPAPAVILVRFHAYDPWIQQDGTVDFTVNLLP